MRYWYKKCLAYVTACCVVCTSFPGLVWAGEIEDGFSGEIEYRYDGEQMREAIEAALTDGQPFYAGDLFDAEEEDWNKVQKEYVSLLKEGHTYEVYADFDEGSTEEIPDGADIRIFLRTDGQGEDGVTEEDQLVFLFSNETESTLKFKVAVGDQETAVVKVAPATTEVVEEETEAETMPEEKPELGTSSNALPMVQSSPEIGTPSDAPSLDTAEEKDKSFTKLRGEILSAVSLSDTCKARAYVVDVSELTDMEAQNYPYELTVKHILEADGNLYYEEQKIGLFDTDFTDGSYDYAEAVYQDRTGIAVKEEKGRSVSLTSFEGDDNRYQAVVEVGYGLLPGYQVVLPKARMTMNGFPDVVAGNLHEMVDGIPWVITPEMGNQTYTVYGSAKNAYILVEAGVEGLVLVLGGEGKELSIDAAGTKHGGIEVASGVDVTLLLGGESEIKGADDHAGIQLGTEQELAAKVTIKGLEDKGSLSAAGGKGGAGIGGGLQSSNGVTVIESGNVTATGGEGAAGIGGGNGAGSNASYKDAIRSGGTIEITGGDVKAVAGSNAAAIGGGNHGDGGKITIDGDARVEAFGSAAGIGSGLGSSSWEKKAGDQHQDTKGPGYYNGGEISIGGNCSVTATGGKQSAGIGGGMYADSGTIVITGGTIRATGMAGNSGTEYQGGAGIGGGYMGHANVVITGGDIHAFAEDSGDARNAAAGIGSGAVPNDRGGSVNGRPASSGDDRLRETYVEISGGTVGASASSAGGAGIGGGYGADGCRVVINKGTVTAKGAVSSRDEKLGGAGIGGGYYGSGLQNKYPHTTDVDVEINGGDITAIGGFGASGIGSGSGDKRADNVVINNSGSLQLKAFADGTKFAVDTYDRMNGESAFASWDGARILMGTFMDRSGEHMNYEGLNVTLFEDENKSLTGDQVSPGESAGSFKLPEGYRSFATDVESGDGYLVSAGDQAGNVTWMKFDTGNASETMPVEGGFSYHYSSAGSQVSDHYWLYAGGNVEEIEPGVPDESSSGQSSATEGSTESGGSSEGTTTDATTTEAATTEPTQPSTTGGGGNGGGGGGGGHTTTPGRNNDTGGPGAESSVNIMPEDVPLAMLPTDGSSEMITILDDDIPLAALPKTGESAAAGWMAGFSGMMLALYLAMSRKKGQDS